ERPGHAGSPVDRRLLVGLHAAHDASLPEAGRPRAVDQSPELLAGPKDDPLRVARGRRAGFRQPEASQKRDRGVGPGPPHASTPCAASRAPGRERRAVESALEGRSRITRRGRSTCPPTSTLRPSPRGLGSGPRPLAAPSRDACTPPANTYADAAGAAG